MKFYGYVVTIEGKEPLGTEGRTMFEAANVPAAIRRMRRYVSSVPLLPFYKFPNPREYRLFSYTNFYDQSTFKQII